MDVQCSVLTDLLPPYRVVGDHAAEATARVRAAKALP